LLCLIYFVLTLALLIIFGEKNENIMRAL